MEHKVQSKERKKVTERTIRTPEKEKKTNVHVKVATQRTSTRSKRNKKKTEKRSQGREGIKKAQY
jgi:hypothetical protein